MRGISFRGKRIEYGEWVHGYLIGNDVIVGNIVEFNDDYFNTSFWYTVRPETVGQFTGLKDRYGKEIYQGDIIHVPADEYEPEYRGDIKWYGGYWGFDEFYPDGTLCGALFLSSYHDFSEVIGNITDNPEFLKRSQP